MKFIIILLIGFYQKTLSPDHGWLKVRYPYGFCRFYPSCSEYGKQAVMKHGVIRGLFLSFIRVIKCNPFVEPKIDKLTN